ncbi:MAG TPA: hypothetical protein VL294_03620 [Pseudolysinimonas sp.]|jgi:hypothetical protein|nr:hypothetical protein [Pseudolysinimonas sp.]
MSIQQLDAAVALGAAGGMTAGVRPAAPAATGQVAAIRIPPLTGASKAIIAAMVKKTYCVFLPDQSGSMFGAFGDPTGVTAAAAESVLDLLHRSGGGSASVIPWGSDAPARLAAGPLDIRKDLKRLSKALRNGENLGGNDLAAALRRAKLLTPALGPDRQVVYCVITDGIEDATPAIHAAVGDLAPGSVHMCLVDRNGGRTAAMDAAWATVPFGSSTTLDAFDITAMTSQLVDVIATTLGLTAPVITPGRSKK